MYPQIDGCAGEREGFNCEAHATDPREQLRDSAGPSKARATEAYEAGEELAMAKKQYQLGSSARKIDPTLRMVAYRVTAAPHIAVS